MGAGKIVHIEYTYCRLNNESDNQGSERETERLRECESKSNAETRKRPSDVNEAFKTFECCAADVNRYFTFVECCMAVRSGLLSLVLF